MWFAKIAALCIAFVACSQPGQQPVTMPPFASKYTIEKSTSVNNLSFLQEVLAEAPQVFTIAANAVQTITAKKGLRVNVNTGDLEAEDGSAITTPVELSIKELTNAKEMVAADCPTVSNGKLLETAGSYFIGVSSNGKKLRLKMGKTIKIEFPKRGAGMELFYGQRSADGSMNWQPINQKLLGQSQAREKWEKEKKALLKEVDADVPFSNNNAYSSAGIGRHLTTESWFKAYHDTLMEHRRNIIRKNFKQMTQPQIRIVMEAPYKMPRKEVARFKKRDYFNKCGPSIAFYTVDKYDLYFTDLPGTDSVLYRIDSLRWMAMLTRKFESYVDTSAPATNKTASKLLTTPGKAKITVTYYEPVELEQLGWINCDRFYDYPDGVVPEYTLDIKGDVPPTIGVYIIYKSINGVMGTKVATDGKSTINIKEQLPLGAKIDFLVYTNIKNQFLQYKITTTVNTKMVIPVTLKPVPPEQVKKVVFSQP